MSSNTSLYICIQKYGYLKNHDFQLPLMGQIGDKDEFWIVTKSIHVFYLGGRAENGVTWPCLRVWVFFFFYFITCYLRETQSQRSFYPATVFKELKKKKKSKGCQNLNHFWFFISFSNGSCFKICMCLFCFLDKILPRIQKRKKKNLDSKWQDLYTSQWISSQTDSV